MLGGELLGLWLALARLQVIGDPPREDRVQPRPELADRPAVEGRRERAEDRLRGHVLHVGRGQLHPGTGHEDIPVTEHQDPDGGLHGIVGSGLAGRAQVVHELLIAQLVQLMLGKFLESGQ